MIVLVLFTILFTIALVRYTTYQQKANVTSYALPLARACAMDIITHCIQTKNGTIDTSNLTNCRDKDTPAGKVVFNSTVSGQCSNSAPPEGTLASAKLDTINSYKVVCNYSSNSLACSIVSQ